MLANETNELRDGTGPQKNVKMSLKGKNKMQTELLGVLEEIS